MKLLSALNRTEINMITVGFVGWRGMVGSVLMGRMREENDFAAEVAAAAGN